MKIGQSHSQPVLFRRGHGLKYLQVITEALTKARPLSCWFQRLTPQVTGSLCFSRFGALLYFCIQDCLTVRNMMNGARVERELPRLLSARVQSFLPADKYWEPLFSLMKSIIFPTSRILTPLLKRRTKKTNQTAVPSCHGRR